MCVGLDCHRAMRIQWWIGKVCPATNDQ